MFKKFNIFFITFFNTGKIKFAPGTFASLGTCLLFIISINFFNMVTLFIFTVLIFLYSFVAINNTFDSFDSNDPQEIVIDEVIGQMITLLAIPMYETLYLIPKEYYCFFAFILFRIFDIWKPYPINYIDKNTKGALGILLDDIMAGVYTIFIMLVACFFLGG